MDAGAGRSLLDEREEGHEEYQDPRLLANVSVLNICKIQLTILRHVVYGRKPE
jgi:hypothetical protein